MTGNRSLDEFTGGAASGSADVEAPDAEPEASSDAAASTPAPTDADDSIEAEESATVEESAEADGPDGVDGPDRTADAGASDAVEPMAETVVWSPDGGECTACGGSVEERWRDGDELVCGDCKSW